MYQMLKANRRALRILSRAEFLRALWIVILFLSWGTGPIQATVHYVTPTGDAGGLTPVYTIIQDAINAAAPGDEIRVATGVYDQATSISGARQVARINKSLVLRGGYSADFAQWDPAVFPTTIDALNNARGILIIDESNTPYH